MGMVTKKRDVLKEKTYGFSVAIVGLVKHIQVEKKEHVLSKQILRSGTAIGAMVHEAAFGESRLDFVHKMSVALKEAHETNY